MTDKTLYRACDAAKYLGITTNTFARRKYEFDKEKYLEYGVKLYEVSLLKFTDKRKTKGNK